MFRKMPFFLVAILAAIILLDPIIPIYVKQLLYSMSLTIKEIIMLTLPFIIFSLLFNAMVKFNKGSGVLIGFIILSVCLSNFISTFISQYAGIWIYHFDISVIEPKQLRTGLTPLWEVQLPKLISNDKAMFAGVIFGLLATRLNYMHLDQISSWLGSTVAKIFSSFVYFIPLFISGYVSKLQYDGVLMSIAKDYTLVFMMIIIAQFGYISFLYLLLNKFHLHNTFKNLRSMAPAVISGFTTMSSAASMPLTIMAVKESIKNKDLADVVVPATVNIHLIGDCFAIPIFAFAVLKSFGIAEPTFVTYMVFAFYFVIAKFSVASVPGGGILVMLPILESHLGFNGDMLPLITALYVLFDPVITSANVLGNGAFAKLIDTSVRMLTKRRQKKVMV